MRCSMFALFRPAFYISKFSFSFPLRKNSHRGYAFSLFALSASLVFHACNEYRDLSYIVGKLERYIFAKQELNAYKLLNLIGDILFNTYMFAVIYLVLFNTKKVIQIFLEIEFILRGINFQSSQIKRIKNTIYGVTMFLIITYYGFRLYDITHSWSSR
jgi:hypothetical protein